MKRKSTWLMLLLLGLLLVLPAATTWAGPAGIVSVDQVNLRTEPDQDSAAIGVLYKKDVVEILMDRKPYIMNNFVRVRVSRAADASLVNMEGWVFKKYLYVPQAD